MRYFSLFSGVGGFEIGIERAYDMVHRGHAEPRGGDVGHGPNAKVVRPYPASPACIDLSEIDKHASAVLRYRFPNVKNYGNIQTIDWAAVPDFDLLVGGSPCQDLSVAGKRAGLEGGRSGLFYEYVRALEEKNPSHFVWENVKGALSSNGGRDFAAILDAFSEAGYSLWWQVLNAKDFGVPQNRERVFVVGTRSDLGSPREVFFERSPNKEDIEPVSSSTIDANYWKGLDNHGARTGIAEEARIRRLMPVECERLMSWPDDWTKHGDYGDGSAKEVSDTQRYKMCGNGVVSEVVSAVVREHLL